MIVVSVIGIILAFAVLIFAAYKKISMFLAAVLAAAIVALFGGLDVAASLVGADGPFLIGMKDFVGSWLVIFALGALLGALYDKSGATWRISSTLINKAGTQWTLLIYVLVGALLGSRLLLSRGRWGNVLFQHRNRTRSCLHRFSSSRFYRNGVAFLQRRRCSRFHLHRCAAVGAKLAAFIQLCAAILTKCHCDSSFLVTRKSYKTNASISKAHLLWALILPARLL